MLAEAERITKLIPLAPDEQEIFNLIASMMNGVQEQRAYTDLNKFLKKMPTKYTNPKIFDHVIVLLSIHKFKPKVRKFIFNLFEHLIFGDFMSDVVINI